MDTPIDRTIKQPVFRQIYDILVSEMENGLYVVSGKLPSEKELCGRFDVERNTIRKALRVMVDECRIARVPGIGSKILTEEDARKIMAKRGQASSIIILITQIDYLSTSDGESFHYKLIHSLEKRLYAQGYNLLFKPVGKDGIVTDTIRSAAPLGIIFDSFNPDAYYREALGCGLPCVSVNHHTPLFTSIVSGNFDGAYRVAEHLINAGHEKIAYVLGKSSHQTNLERLSGVHSLYTARSLTLSPEYLIPGDWTFSSGLKAAETILRMKPADRPTAVFAFNDDLAYGCYTAFHRSGLNIPDDISIVGFDKSDRYNGMFPPITTVDVNLEAIVDYACWYLSAGISGKAPKISAKIQLDTMFCDNGTIKLIDKGIYTCA